VTHTSHQPNSWLQGAGSQHAAFNKLSELECCAASVSASASEARVNMVTHCSISAVPQYSTKSAEELRYEDYEDWSGPKQQGAWGSPAAAAGLGTSSQGDGFESASLSYTPASGAMPQVRCARLA
jgi:hypothetical protein